MIGKLKIEIEDPDEPTPNPQRPFWRDPNKEIWPRPKLDNRPGLEERQSTGISHSAHFIGIPDAESCSPSAFGFVTHHAPAVY